MNRSCEDRVTLRLMDLLPNCLELAVNVYGYVIPVLASFVTVVNILIVKVFMKQHVRSHTTMILSLIACTDMIGIDCSAVIFVYHYLFGYYKELLTCRQIELTYIFGNMCRDMFNMFSLWLTVLLAFIRCRCIKFPLTARHVHSTGRIVAYVIGIWIVVCLVHIPTFFYFDFKQTEVVDPSTNLTHVVCDILETEGLVLKSCSRRKVYLLVENLFDSIVPCIFLLYNNFVMIFTLRRAKQNRSSLRRNDSFMGECQTPGSFEKQSGYTECRETLQYEMKCMGSNKEVNSEKKRDEPNSSGEEIIENKCCSILSNRKEVNEQMNTMCVTLAGCFQRENLNVKEGGASTSSDPTLDKLDKESRRTSWLILVLSSIIVVHEIPLAIANAYSIISHTNKPLPLTTTCCLSVIQTLWQFITYPVIFLIYVCMSRAFRIELWQTLCMFHTCKGRQPRLSKKRQSFLSPCLVRKLTATNEEIFACQSQDKTSDNNYVFDTINNESRNCNFEIST